MKQDRLESAPVIISKARAKATLSREDITALLKTREPAHLEQLFRAARETRERFFGDQVFLYGFLYISTFCRNNCRFCYYRVSNPDSLRYRKEENQIIEAAVELAKSGVHLIDLTMGEDSLFFNGTGTGFEPLVRLVENVKQATGLPVMISPGVIPGHALESFARAGAEWFACYQETHNRELFSRLRPGQDYDARLQTKIAARRHCMLTEEGILVGVGETAEDIADSFQVMRDLDVQQVRAMNFVPQPGTPMAENQQADSLRELILIALMRLSFPRKLIPATLDVEGLDGLKRRLDAGANVVTSIVPPRQGLAGVAQSSLDINEARRTISSIMPVLNQCNLKPANLNRFIDWTKQNKHPEKAGETK